jgi:hypothetical protein
MHELLLRKINILIINNYEGKVKLTIPKTGRDGP